MSAFELREWSKWLAVQNSPWTPPGSLDLTQLNPTNDSVIWLSRAVDLMAFGDEGVPGNLVEAAARRGQASRELCQAARRGVVSMIGAPQQTDASDPIPRAYFDTPRQLGARDNSLAVFSDPISDDEFFPIDVGGGYQKWFNVRVETRSLLSWLGTVCSVNVDAVDTARPADAEHHLMRLEGRGRIHIAVFKAMEDIWPDHRVPKGLSNKEIHNRIQPGLKKRGVAERSGHNDIRRILRLK